MIGVGLHDDLVNHAGLLECGREHEGRVEAGADEVAEHDLGAAAYAIKSAQDGARRRGGEAGRRTEAAWQRDRIPDEVRALVLEDMARRNDLCWSVFDVSA